MTHDQFLKVAFALLESMRTRNNRRVARIGLKRPKRPFLEVKRDNLGSDIGGVYWLPDEVRLETAKRLVNEGLLEVEDMKDYLAGDWN